MWQVWSSAVFRYCAPAIFRFRFSASVSFPLDDITVFSSDLEENGIEAIEEVELKFHIYDADSYFVIADSEPITFSAQ